MARSCDQFIVWTWTRRSTDWTQRTIHGRIFYTSIRKTANVGAVLERRIFAKLCELTKVEVLEIDTDSLYLTLGEKELEDCIKPDKRVERKRLRPNDSADSFTADDIARFFPQKGCLKHKKNTIRESLAFSKEDFRCTEMLCLWSKTYCCWEFTFKKSKFSSKGQQACTGTQWWWTTGKLS